MSDIKLGVIDGVYGANVRVTFGSSTSGIIPLYSFTGEDPDPKPGDSAAVLATSGGDVAVIIRRAAEGLK